MRHLNVPSLVIGLALSAGCESLPDELVDARRTDAVDLPTIQYDYTGSYDVGGTWDLSRPFGDDGLGGVVADLMIDRVVTLAGVPSALEGEARAAIAARIRAPIVAYVDGAIPAELLTTSPTMMALDQIFSAVAVEGNLALVAAADPDDCTGTDTVTALAVTHQSVVHDISMTELTGGAVSVAAPFTGTASGAATLTLGQHELQIHFGELVAIVAREALGVDVFALSSQAWAGVSCPAVVDSFTSGAGFSITVAGNTFSVSDATLESGCGALKVMLADHALGMFRRDAGIRLGGAIGLGGTGRTVTSLASEPGYGGVITMFPLVQPAMTSTFSLR